MKNIWNGFLFGLCWTVLAIAVIGPLAMSIVFNNFRWLWLYLFAPPVLFATIQALGEVDISGI